MTYSDAILKDILTRTKVIACVGLSDDPARPSHEVAHFLAQQGYRVIGINPTIAGQVVAGEVVQPDLAALAGEKIDLVDIFRRPDAVPAVVDAALAHLPDLRTIWMQLGVSHTEAAAKAEARGITVIQNRCPKIEYRRLLA